MQEESQVNSDELRAQVKEKYRAVAVAPDAEYHFHTGRPLAARLGYDSAITDSLSDAAVESFAGVGNPFSLRALQQGEKIVDAGSGSGFDCFVAATLVGDQGQVVGVDMTEEMLTKSRATAVALGADNIDIREGLLEELPLQDAWADVVISNGVINLCSDKQRAFAEIFRVLKPGGHLQFADIANSEPVPQSAINNIDLWTS
ncbi:MAG: methyltransferase type 11 [Gammaproteobacteria bacterium]|nr:methyltransferase type 11 [Gammaproteobacteria bacterium]HJN97098.1 methyltransferase domain-containing protein [Gammaproteobacteria bacterium]